MNRASLAALTAAAGLTFFSAIARGETATGSASVPGREARVVNGVLAQDRPTTGALLSTFGINHQLICSGTLIGCETFLTAAHCVCDASPFDLCGTPSPANYAVYLQDVGIVGVSSIDVDPTYSFTDQGDVAVVTLSSPVTGVHPAPINTLTRPPLGTSVEIAGFGLTRGGAGDIGLLRRGLAETSECTDADGDYHVCWAFTAPLGAAGIDSNTCNGDSGGPLFADLGSGNSVVGITSGGAAADCMPTDASYDTDVFVHAGYIDGIGGADLLSTSCGTIAQVGEAGADRATFDFDTLSKQQQSCRKSVSRMYATYVTAVLKASQRCLDGVAAGTRTGPCPDAEATGALDRAAVNVSVEKLSSKCPDDVAPTIHVDGQCTSAANASDLAGCILAAGDAALGDALASEYADDSPTASIPDADAADCQKAVGSACAALLKSTLRAATRCQVSLAGGRAATCPDARTAEKISKAEGKVGDRIASGCTDAAVALLDGSDSFGGSCAGVATTTALTACEILDHESIRDDLLALLRDQEMETDVSFTVPPGAALLRVTINGKDSGTNDIDLYIRAGSPATTTLYDDRSENGGMFEATEITSPVAGTWYAHIEHFSGDTQIPYQLTATAFQP